MTEASSRIYGALAKVPWLNACGEEMLKYLAANSTLEHAADGSTVTWRGHQMTHLLIPAHGLLELSMSNAQGKRHVISRLASGQVFGLVPVLEDSTAIHDAVARGGCEFVLVSQAVFRQAMRDFPVLNEQVIRMLCARARQYYQALAEQTLAPLPVRLARVLFKQLQVTESQTVIMSQSDLSDMLGISRQSLNIELKRFERQGIIELARGRIEVQNPDQLKALASLP